MNRPRSRRPGRRTPLATLVAGGLAPIAVAAIAAPSQDAVAGPRIFAPAEFPPGACPAPDVQPFLLEDDPAPGTGANFQAFDRPVISSSGHVVFTADTDGPTTGDDVVYVDTTLVAREGDPAPGVAGGVFASFEFFETAQQVNGSGLTAYIATLRDVPPGTDRAVYFGSVLIARTGDEADGAPGRNFTEFGFAGLTDDGRVGFLADLDGSTGDDSVICLGETMLYREGDFLPFLPGEAWDGNFGEVQWNGRGDVLLVGNTSLPTANDMVVCRRMIDTESGVVEEIVAQEGQPVAAHTGPDLLDDVLQIALAENGAWALRGVLANAAADANGVIMSETGFFAQEGDPVDELPGVVLGNFSGVAVNSMGQVLYLADLIGATPVDTDEGLFLNGCLLLTDGADAAGLPEGTIFTDLGFEDISINDDGQVVFAAGYGGNASGDGLFRFTIAAPCVTDLDGTGDTGLDDLTVLIGSWGDCPDPSGTCVGDLDADGSVGFDDLLVLLIAWGPCP